MNEQMDRHRPSGASVMNARDPMSKQKMSNICEPGPLKRAQGMESFQIHYNRWSENLKIKCLYFLTCLIV
jgi:hypothetical protein